MGPEQSTVAPWAALGDLPSTDFAAQQSSAGRAWMASLPAQVAELTNRWDLAVESTALWHGYNSVVLPVLRDRRRLALKLSWPPGPSLDEIGALRAWQGRGAVELLAADASRGALLLERLDADRSLQAVDLMEAAAIAGSLVRTLAVPTSEPFPTSSCQAHEIAGTLPQRQQSLGHPVPAGWAAAAVEQAGRLATPRRGLLIHCDLHYDNVLAGDRPEFRWLAIDPKPAVGDPERSVAELLWTRVDEVPGAEGILALLRTITRAGRLDEATAVSWAFVRSIDYWLWGLQKNLTVDPLRCERIAAALAPLVASS